MYPTTSHYSVIFLIARYPLLLSMKELMHSSQARAKPHLLCAPYRATFHAVGLCKTPSCVGLLASTCLSFLVLPLLKDLSRPGTTRLELDISLVPPLQKSPSKASGSSASSVEHFHVLHAIMQFSQLQDSTVRAGSRSVIFRNP